MSDLAATQCNTGCGCNTRCGCDNDGGCCTWLIWILLLSCFCGNGNNNWGNGFCGDNNCFIWIILILCCCNGGNSFF